MVDWKTIRQNAGPYPQAAFDFVRHGLQHTAESVHGPDNADSAAMLPTDDEHEASRHVSGQQLCLGLRDYALKKYGRLARLVLSRWSIRRTDDFGRIVFAMIDGGLMRKTEQDTIEDFVEVYDFDEAFECSEN